MWKLMLMAFLGLVLLIGFGLSSAALEINAPQHSYGWISQNSTNYVPCATLYNAINLSQTYASTAESVTLNLTLTSLAVDPCTIEVKLSGIGAHVNLNPDTKQQSISLEPGETKTIAWVITSTYPAYTSLTVDTTAESTYISFNFIPAHLGLTIAQMRFGLLLGLAVGVALMIPWLRFALRVPEDTI